MAPRKPAAKKPAEDYIPKFDRVGTERRVLGHITNEDHVGRGPRNTLERLQQELAEDPHTNYDGDGPELQGYFDALEGAGLVKRHENGTYSVTAAGRTELAS
jgi:ribosomal protein S19E (S16A)